MRPLLALTIVLLVPALAVAETQCEPTTSDTTVCLSPAPCVSADAAGLYYVAYDPCNPAAKCIWSVWIYEESNGMPGLQRQDEIVDDTCRGQIRGDTILF